LRDVAPYAGSVSYAAVVRVRASRQGRQHTVVGCSAVTVPVTAPPDGVHPPLVTVEGVVIFTDPFGSMIALYALHVSVVMVVNAFAHAPSL